MAGPKSSNEPVFTLPAWRQTISGRSPAGSALGEAVEPQPSLVVGVDDECTRARPEAEVLERRADRRVRLGADDDVDRRRPGQAVVLDVPAPVGEHPVARRRQTGDVRHLAARRQPEARSRREPEEVDQPRADHLLDDRCRRPRA